MVNLPDVAEPLLMSFSLAFIEPTFLRSLVLLVGAIFATGGRTITNLLWNVGDRNEASAEEAGSRDVGYGSSPAIVSTCGVTRMTRCLPDLHSRVTPASVTVWPSGMRTVA